MRIALVYDRVNKFGGAERVLLALHEIWPEAPLYTAVYDLKGAPWAKDFQVIPSFLQKIPFAKSRHEMLALLMPMAFESFDFDKYDVVVSITSEAAKGIITKPKALHICYCLTPTRYLWSGYEDYFSTTASQPCLAVRRVVSKPAISYLRKWDLIAAQRPDYYLAISENVRKRIKKYYKRDSEVIYPPVTLKQKTKNKRQKTQTKKEKNEKYFLVVSRLVSYKKVDIAIEAFNKLGWSLKIVGLGSEKRKLERLASNNIEFLGKLTDDELVGYYQGCQAVIFPQEEDFGIVPLEAQACGKPVIAYKGGGALETIIPGKTGEFFWPQTSKALIKSLKSLKGLRSSTFKGEDCRKQAEKFSKEKFKEKFSKIVSQLWKKHQKTFTS